MTPTPHQPDSGIDIEALRKRVAAVREDGFDRFSIELPELDALLDRLERAEKERAEYQRMFLAACEDLGAINEELGLDPDDGGADPIIEAIKAIRAEAAAGAVPDDESEALEILDNLIDSVKKHGNYSAEATLGFLGQLRQCLAVAPEAAPSQQAKAAPSEAKPFGYIVCEKSPGGTDEFMYRQAWDNISAEARERHVIKTELFAAPPGQAERDSWTQAPPTEQAWYWHWNGDEDCAPFPLSVMWSGTAMKCFVAIHQLDAGTPHWCDEYGGYWLLMREPDVPAIASSAERNRVGNQ